VLVTGGGGFLGSHLVARLRDAGVDRELRGKEGASDHAPAWATFDAAKRRSAPPRSRIDVRLPHRTH